MIQIDLYFPNGYQMGWNHQLVGIVHVLMQIYVKTRCHIDGEYVPFRDHMIVCWCESTTAMRQRRNMYILSLLGCPAGT